MKTWLARWGGAVLCLGLLAGYMAIIYIRALDARPEHRVDLVAGQHARTTVRVHPSVLQTTAETMHLELDIEPGRALTDSHGMLNQDLTVSVFPGSSASTTTFHRGHPVGTIDARVRIDGDNEMWPFDRYRLDNLIIDLGTGPEQRPLDADITVDNALSGWVLEESVTPTAPGQPAERDIALRRAASSIAFDLTLCALLVSLPVFALFVAALTILGKRPFYPPMVGWFAMMLFAAVPLRTAFPGAPPLGALIDRSIVLWVLIGLVAGMGMYVAAWWKEGRPDPA